MITKGYMNTFYSQIEEVNKNLLNELEKSNKKIQKFIIRNRKIKKQQ